MCVFEINVPPTPKAKQKRYIIVLQITRKFKIGIVFYFVNSFYMGKMGKQ